MDNQFKHAQNQSHFAIFVIINVCCTKLNGYFENKPLLLEWNGFVKLCTKVGLSNRLIGGKCCFAQINLRFQYKNCDSFQCNVLLKMWKIFPMTKKFIVICPRAMERNICCKILNNSIHISDTINTVRMPTKLIVFLWFCTYFTSYFT